MRLRLVVKRHDLPDAAVVWAVDTQPNPTIAQLLEQINEVIPLESEGEWGLEDYAVELQGKTANFECLHFQLVKAILHEDDEVIVRPLLTQDIKQRRISGRHQITSDGRHLYDGTVFGRPRRRAIVDRPQVAIPPRKKRRITYTAQDDEYYLDDAVEEQLAMEQQLAIQDQAYESEGADSSTNNQNQLAFEDQIYESDGSSSSYNGEDSGGSSSSESDSIQRSSSNSSSEGDSGSDSSLDSDSDTDTDTDSDSSDGSSISDSSSSSSSDSDSEPEVQSSKERPSLRAPVTAQPKPTPPQTVPPGQGRKATKARNDRRRKSTMMQRYKEREVLPAGVSLTDFNEMNIDESTTPEEAAAEWDRVKNERAKSKSSSFEAKRQELLASLALGGIEVGSGASNTTSRGTVESAPGKAEQRTSKLDVEAGKRMVYGSLGLRTPQSKDEEQQLHERLSASSQLNRPTEHDDENEDDVDESWRDSIVLSAVECCEEGVELSEPPFPFVQRWDPQQQYRSGRRRSKGRRRQSEQYAEEGAQQFAKKQRQNKDEYSYVEDSYYDEGYDVENMRRQQRDQDKEEQLQLDYDEPEAVVEGETQAVDEDDLVPLPEDPSTLVDIQPNDITPGMVIAFKQLIMSEATSWQPTISEFRTAVVVSVEAAGQVELTLAQRDREYSEKYYDEETGERVYGRFEMPADEEEEEEEEEEDDGNRSLGLTELLEVKLVQDASQTLGAQEVDT